MARGSHNRVAVLHGPNFNLLGSRDPEHYGEMTLAQLERQVKAWADELGLEATFFQTNHEGEFVEYVHRLPDVADAAIVNAGAWSHYSYAIRDALEFAGVPAIEVHLSDISAREEFRSHSVFDGVVSAKIYGKKADGYREALGQLASELGSDE
jgi:3-dehydroquinate dehydratase-2